MTQSNVKPVYPSGIFPWTDKVDNSDIDFAANVNSLASEVESIETTLGTNAQNEPLPPVGNPVNYSTVSARISDAMSNAQLPYAVLQSGSMTVGNNDAGELVRFTASLDPYKMYNGNDITIPVNGWWFVSSSVLWNWWTTGYSHHFMTLNGSTNILDETVLNWEFPGNIQPLSYTADGFPISPPPVISTPPRWQLFGRRPLKTSTLFHGPLHAGDRISVWLENGTSNSFFSVTNLSMHAYLLRTIPPSVTFTSG